MCVCLRWRIRLLDDDPCQTQEGLAESLGVTQQAISKCLKALGFIQNSGNWVLLELRSSDVERRFTICEMQLQRQKRTGFLHRVVTCNEKWIYLDSPKRKMHTLSPAYQDHRHQSKNEYMVSRLCSVFGGIKIVSCIKSCRNLVKQSRKVVIDYNWCVWDEHWTKIGQNGKINTKQ